MGVILLAVGIISAPLISYALLTMAFSLIKLSLRRSL